MLEARVTRCKCGGAAVASGRELQTRRGEERERRPGAPQRRRARAAPEIRCWRLVCRSTLTSSCATLRLACETGRVESKEARLSARTDSPRQRGESTLQFDVNLHSSTSSSSTTSYISPSEFTPSISSRPTAPSTPRPNAELEAHTPSAPRYSPYPALSLTANRSRLREQCLLPVTSMEKEQSQRRGSAREAPSQPL